MDVFKLRCWVLMLAVCLRAARPDQLTPLSLSGKPASQSTRSSGHHALDGSLSTFSHTEPSTDLHPWWKVDLEGEHCLGKIIIQLRLGCCGEHRFAGSVVRAGLSSDYAQNQPCGLPATREQSVNGALNEFTCEVPRMARYVSVDIDSTLPVVTNAILQLAEVKVEEYPVRHCYNASLGQRHFRRIYTGSVVANSTPLSVAVCNSLTRCAARCLRTDLCYSFAYDAGNQRCQLHSIKEEAIEPTTSEGFSIYAMFKSEL